MKKFLAFILSAALAMQCIIVTSASAEGFSDMNGHWAQATVEKMADKGIARGRAEGIFAPEDSITRAEYLTLACRILGYGEAVYTGVFSDLTGTEWYAGYAQAGYNAGLIPSGMISDGRFMGDALITREEIAAISIIAKEIFNGNSPHKVFGTINTDDAPDWLNLEAINAEKFSDAGFTDYTQVSKWAEEYVVKAVSDGIINGLDKTTLAPKSNATRAQAIVMLSRISPFYSADNMLSADYTQRDMWDYVVREGDHSKGYPTATVELRQNDGNSPNDGGIFYDVEWSGSGGIINALQMYYMLRDSNGAAIKRGETYKVGFYAKLEGVPSVSCNAVKLRDPDSNSINYSNTAKFNITEGGWTEYSMELTATQTLEEVKLIFMVGGDDQRNFKIAFDSFYMIPVGGSEKKITLSCAGAEQSQVSLTGTGTYELLETPEITATAAEGSGLIPDCWMDSYGNKVSPNSTYSVLAEQTASYTAVFGKYSYANKAFEAPVSDKLTATVSAPEISGNTAQTTASVTVPEGYTLMDAGVIFYPGIWTENFNLFSENITNVRAVSVSNGTFTAKTSMDTRYGVLARSYAIAKDANGQVSIVYSEDMYTKSPTAAENKEYKLLFYHELMGLFTADTPNNPEEHAKFVDQLAATGADVITVTPSIYKYNLWKSNVDPYWTTESEYSVEKPSAHINDARLYVLNGGDPIADTLKATKKHNIDVLIDQRMNDYHNNANLKYETHSTFWLNHPEYWLYQEQTTNNSRNLNYMEPEVRDYFYGLIEELVTNYDVDGANLDFCRHVGYFRDMEMRMGTEVMTNFVGRVSEMINRISVDKGKNLQLGVRLPNSASESISAGLDYAAWDAKQYIDILNVSENMNPLTINIESYDETTKNAKIFAETSYLTYQSTSNSFDRRHITEEIAYANASNFLARGADGVSFFNLQYITEGRDVLYPQLSITKDAEALAKAEKNYVVNSSASTIKVIINEDTDNFSSAILRAETTTDSTGKDISASFNGTELKQIKRFETELFPAYTSNPAYASAECVRFFELPPELLKTGENIINLNAQDVEFRGIQIGLYN